MRRAGHKVSGGLPLQTQVVLRCRCDSVGHVYESARVCGALPTNGRAWSLLRIRAYSRIAVGARKARCARAHAAARRTADSAAVHTIEVPVAAVMCGRGRSNACICRLTVRAGVARIAGRARAVARRTADCAAVDAIEERNRTYGCNIYDGSAIASARARGETWQRRCRLRARARARAKAGARVGCDRPSQRKPTVLCRIEAVDEEIRRLRCHARVGPLLRTLVRIVTTRHRHVTRKVAADTQLVHAVEIVGRHTNAECATHRYCDREYLFGSAATTAEVVEIGSTGGHIRCLVGCGWKCVKAMDLCAKTGTENAAHALGVLHAIVRTIEIASTAVSIVAISARSIPITALHDARRTHGRAFLHHACHERCAQSVCLASRR